MNDTKAGRACVRFLLQIDLRSLISLHVQKAASGVNKPSVESTRRERQMKCFIS